MSSVQLHMRIPYLCLLFTLLSACSTEPEETTNTTPKAPSTPVTIIEPGESYFKDQQPISLTCTDNDNDCLKTYFTIDGSEPQQIPEHLYKVSFKITVENVAVTIKYFSVDKSNLQEITQTKIITWDTKAPELTVQPSARDFNTAVSIFLSCSDTDGVDGSNCSAIFYTSNDNTVPDNFIRYSDNAIVINNNTLLSYYAIDSLGNQSAVMTQAYTFDTIAPANVTGLNSAVANAKVSLSWTSPQDSDFAGVIIKRATGDYPVNENSGELIYTGTQSSFVDNTVANGTKYYYRVFAFDNAQNYSAGADNISTPVSITTSPTDNAIGVETTAINISATFDAPMQTTSFTKDTFNLSQKATPVLGDVRFDLLTNSAIFTPTDSFAINTNYTATLTNSVATETNNPLASNYTWNFTTADGKWNEDSKKLLVTLNPSRTIGDVIQYGNESENFNGNFFAIWKIRNSVGAGEIVVARYDDKIGWLNPNSISNKSIHSTRLYNSIGEFQVQTDKDGNGIMLWDETAYAADQVTAIGRNLYAINYNTRTIWKDWIPPTPTLLAYYTSGNWIPYAKTNIKFDNLGNAIIIWPLTDANNDTHIWANYYSLTNGWGAEKMISTGVLPVVADSFDINLDPNNNWLFSWKEADKTTKLGHIYAQYYDTVNNWNNWDSGITRKKLDNSTPIATGSAIVSMDKNGNTIFLWRQGAQAELFANYYDATTPWNSWNTTTTVLPSFGNGFPIELATDAQGNSIAVYMRKNLTTGYALYSVRFDLTNGWKNWQALSQKLLAAEISRTYTLPNLKIDSYGNAIVLWVVPGNNHIAANYYDNSKTWENNWNVNTSIIIDSNSNDLLLYRGGIQLGDIVFDKSGNALIVWAKSRENLEILLIEYNIWAYYFDKTTGWDPTKTTTPQVVDKNTKYSAGDFPRVIADESDNLMITWLEPVKVDNFNGIPKTYYHLWGNRIVADEWNKISAQNATQLDITSAPPFDPNVLEVKNYNVKFNKKGRVTLFWYQEASNISNPKINVWAKRFE